RVIVPFVFSHAGAPLPLSVGDAPGLIAFAFFGPHHAKRKRIVAVFAVIHEAEIDFVFPRKEKFVRWWKNGERPGVYVGTGRSVEDEQTIARTNIDGILIGRTAKIVFLPHAGCVTPCDF